MGTDISIYIEKYSLEKGWHYVGWEQDILGGSLMGRNYTLYSLLANQEADYTWLDDTTTKGVIPIAPPRGIPFDADPEEDYKHIPFVIAPNSCWYPSWVTLKEVMEYPHWETYLYIEKEHISLDEYKEVIKDSIIHEIIEIKERESGRKINEEELKTLLNIPSDNLDKQYTISIKGKQKYKDRYLEFLTEFVPRLRKLTDRPEYLRLVYDFW